MGNGEWQYFFLCSHFTHDPIPQTFQTIGHSDDYGGWFIKSKREKECNKRSHSVLSKTPYSPLTTHDCQWAMDSSVVSSQ